MTDLLQAVDPLALVPSAEQLQLLASRKRTEYQTAEPYPHFVLDDFLDPAVADAVLDEFPGPGAIAWEQFKNAREEKLASAHEGNMPPLIRGLLYAMNGATFLHFLEVLTGIPKLMPDPLFTGGGLHQILPGGRLAAHVDFNKHPVYGLDRRLNLLLYLNKDWDDSFGGHFELLDATGKECRKRVLPVFNRCVVFSTTDTSWHGHPHPLTCPPGGSRKSLALYYYTNGRPDQSLAGVHGTLFHDAPASLPSRIGRGAKALAVNLLPPIVPKAFRWLGR